MAARAIFVYSGFRSASTWFWSRLRVDERLCCYYEPFNEQLAHLSPQNLLEAQPSGWRSHHPDGVPYMLEYAPLLGDTPGVPGYPIEEAPGSRFIGKAGVDGPLDPDVEAYVASLIASATERTRLPVLACTRMFGRAAGLRALGGYHILLIRNLFQQWNSYAGQSAFNNDYFLYTLYQSLVLAEQDEFIKIIANYFSDESRRSFSTWIAKENFDRVFCYFVGYHIYFLLKTRRCVDLEVDVNALARLGEDYCRKVADEIFAETGTRLDLTDARENVDYPRYPIQFRRECKAVVRGMADKALAVCKATPEERRFVNDLLQAMWEEQARFAYYTGGAAELIQTREAQHAELVQTLEARHADTIQERLVEAQRALEEARTQEATLADQLHHMTMRATEAETQAAEWQVMVETRAAQYEDELRSERDQVRQFAETAKSLKAEGVERRHAIADLENNLRQRQEELAQAWASVKALETQAVQAQAVIDGRAAEDLKLHRQLAASENWVFQLASERRVLEGQLADAKAESATAHAPILVGDGIGDDRSQGGTSVGTLVSGRADVEVKARLAQVLAVLTDRPAGWIFFSAARRRRRLRESLEAIRDADGDGEWGAGDEGLMLEAVWAALSRDC